MFRKFVGAVFLAAVTLGLATGEEFFAVVHKVEGGKVTFRKLRDRKAKEYKPPGAYSPVGAWFITDDSGKTIKEMRVMIPKKVEGK